MGRPSGRQPSISADDGGSLAARPARPGVLPVCNVSPGQSRRDPFCDPKSKNRPSAGRFFSNHNDLHYYFI